MCQVDKSDWVVDFACKIKGKKNSYVMPKHIAVEIIIAVKKALSDESKFNYIDINQTVLNCV